MKKTFPLIITLAATALLSLVVSCKKTFQEANTNPYEPTNEMLNYNNLKVAAYFPQLAKAVIPIGTPGEATGPVNSYQLSIDLGPNNWSGYLAARSEKFDGGNNFTTYFSKEDWLTNVYINHTTPVISPWLAIKQGTDSIFPEIFAIAQIMKIAAYHQATDMFGPMPYKSLGPGGFTVPYDSQQDIYNSFFTELAAAVKVLTPLSTTLIIPQYDVVYGGHADKWIRFANSLMLRLAMRISYADPANAQKYAQMAISNPGGLIDDVADAAKIQSGTLMTFMNPLKTIWDGYGDTRICASIMCYLKGYSDPRLPKYAQQVTIAGTAGYYGVRTGVSITSPDYLSFSPPNIVDATPLNWLMASEVSFLKSEAALRGWSAGGTALQFYNDGILKSFQENNVSLATYTDNTSLPASYTDPTSADRNAPPPSAITVKWDETAGFETKLEKIITQKYIALFPNGPEAWAEYRRTGYPKLIPITLNRSGGIVSSTTGMRRLNYPQTEYVNNLVNVTKAVQLLGGQDNGATKVWWDKK